MKHVMLIRHGETAYNLTKTFMGWQDIPLNDTGILQAKETASVVQRRPDAIFSSDLKRATETASIVREQHGGYDTPLLIDWRLRERCFGDLEGQPHGKQADNDFFSANPDERPYDSESENNFNQRVWSFISDLELTDYETICIVTHSGVINRFGYILTPGHTFTVYPNASVTTYDIDPKMAVNHWKMKVRK